MTTIIRVFITPMIDATKHIDEHYFSLNFTISTDAGDKKLCYRTTPSADLTTAHKNLENITVYDIARGPKRNVTADRGAQYAILTAINFLETFEEMKKSLLAKSG